MAILDALGNAFQGMGCRSRQVDKSEDKYEDELDGDSYIFWGRGSRIVSKKRVK